MLKKLIFLIVIALASYYGYIFVTTSLTEIEETTEQTQIAGVIETKVGQRFSIKLVAEIEPGYQWNIGVYNPVYLKAAGRSFEYVDSGQAIGNQKLETFNFDPIKAGQTEITFNYSKPLHEDKKETGRSVWRVIIK